MLRSNKRMFLEPSGGMVLWPGSMTAQVSLCNKRRKVMPSSAASVLPDEIMTEVFLRLPIKSILRFRAVCRSWDALLSSEEFCDLHMAATEVAPTPPKLLFATPAANLDYSTAIYSCSLSGHGDDQLLTIDDARGNFVDVSPAPCRGLTLLYDAVVPAYYVCNAATRSVTRLPPFSSNVLDATAGLGFDSRTKKYKVVRLFRGKGHVFESFFCEVYTLGCEDGDKWRPVSGGVPFRFCSFARSAIWYAVVRKMQPVFADGFLHWMIEPSFFAKVPRAAILSFSLTKETFTWVRSPPFLVSGAHLVKLDDHLCMVRDFREGLLGGSMPEIWKLKDYSSGDWSLKLRIDLSGSVWRDFIEPRVVKVIGSFGSSKTSRKIIIATSKHKVFAYDTLSRTLETIHSTMEIDSSSQSEPSDIRFSLFTESLVPVHKTKEEVALTSPLAKVTEEILLRLPAESTLSFRLVCKQWLRLIKSESFARSFFLRKNMDKRPKIMLVSKGIGQSAFSFIPLNKWIQDPSNEVALLDTKVVCSKPCHGLNLVSIEKRDYLYNPCIGFRSIHRNEGSINNRMWNFPLNGVQLEDHPFAVGNKNVGLGFNPLTQEHVIVELFYHVKNFKSRDYHLTCWVWACDSRHSQQLYPPPLPVSDMPPAYLEGMLYWMSEPRLLGQSHSWDIVSFNIGTNTFGVIPCPSSFATRSSRSSCRAFVVELDGMLCAVLADPVTDELVIWKRELGQWARAHAIYLKSLPDYSLGANIVMPLAVDPTDGRILLSTGRKLGFYNPLTEAIEISFALDQTPLDQPSSTSFGKDVSHYEDKSKEELNGTSHKLMPLVPMLYEESLAYYSIALKRKVLDFDVKGF